MTARIVGLREAEPVGLHADVAGDLLAYMGRRRISQRRLAATLDVDQSTLSRWFSKGMSVEDLGRVLDALGLRAKVTLLDAETGEVTLPYPRPYRRPPLHSVPGLGQKTTGWTPLVAAVPESQIDEL